MAKQMIDHPISEITLRRYEKPEKQTRREAVKKLCLSLGILQPGDSRDVIVDILHVLIEKQRILSSEEIREEVIKVREKNNLALLGIASSNVRRQLKRLREIFLVEKIKNKYRLTENLSLHDIFEEKIKRYLIPSITTRIHDYIDFIEHN